MEIRIKKYMISGIVFTSAAGILSHFLYQWSGKNPLLALISPVNESTWEHMKLIFFPMLLFSLFASTRLKEAAPSLTGALILGNLLGTLSIPILFYTYTGITGQNFFIADLAVFFTAVLTAWGAAWKLRDSAKVFRCRILCSAGVRAVLRQLFLQRVNRCQAQGQHSQKQLLSPALSPSSSCHAPAPFY